MNIQPKKWDEVADKHMSPDQRVRQNFALGLVKCPIGGKVLDVGCGEGNFLRVLENKTFDVVGVDVSLKACKFAVLKVDRAHVIQSDAHHLPFRNKVFNYIFMIDTIEHLPWPKKALEEVCRTIKNAGLFILTTPNGFPLCLARIEDKIRRRRTQQPFNRLLSPRKFTILLRRSNLRIIKTIGFSRRLSTIPLIPLFWRIPIIKDFLCSSIAAITQKG